MRAPTGQLDQERRPSLRINLSTLLLEVREREARFLVKVGVARYHCINCYIYARPLLRRDSSKLRRNKRCCYAGYSAEEVYLSQKRNRRRGRETYYINALSVLLRPSWPPRSPIVQEVGQGWQDYSNMFQSYVAQQALLRLGAIL